MKNIEFILNLLPILFPVFYSLTDDDNNEFVFLDVDNKINDVKNRIVDKTTMEALQNHFHLFERQNKNNKTTILKIGSAISKNLINSLKHNFPEKEFIVYLEINMKDSTIIRFHQLWKDEIPYFDINQLKSKGIEIYEFRIS